MSSSRSERLDKVEQAVHEKGPTPAQLVKSIQRTWDVTEQTARDYVQTLEETHRIHRDGERFRVTDPTKHEDRVMDPVRQVEHVEDGSSKDVENSHQVRVFDGTQALKARVEALEDRVDELEARLEALEALKAGVGHR